MNYFKYKIFNFVENGRILTLEIRKLIYFS